MDDSYFVRMMIEAAMRPLLARLATLERDIAILRGDVVEDPRMERMHATFKALPSPDWKRIVEEGESEPYR